MKTKQKQWDSLKWEPDFEGSDCNDENTMFECELLDISWEGNAVRVEVDSIKTWLPVSQITFYDKPVQGEIVRIEIPNWIAKKNEFMFED